jgi:hypothetical protein
MDISTNEIIITRDIKQQILGLLSEQVYYGNEKMPLINSVHYLAAQLKHALTDNKVSLTYPQRYLM